MAPAGTIPLMTTSLRRAFALLIMAASLVLSIGSRHVRFVDDAWITFRYAANLVNQGELVYNTHERVEGITNLLWALILAAEDSLLPAPIEVLAAGSALVLLSLSLLRIWSLGLALDLDPLLAAVPPILLVLTPNIYGAMQNGLEAALFAFLLAEAVFRVYRGHLAVASLAFGGLFLTRPEALGLGAMGVLLVTWRLSRRGGSAFGKKVLEARGGSELVVAFARLAIPLVMTVALATGFRLWYFGDYVPNSLRAKLYPYSLLLLEGGINYLAGFAAGNPHLMVILLVGAGIFLIGLLRPPTSREMPDRRSEFATAAMGISVLGILYSFVVVLRSGGDWMREFRLLSQYGSLYGCLLLLTLSALLTADGWRVPSRKALERGVASRSSFNCWALAAFLLGLMVTPMWKTASAAFQRFAGGAPFFAMLHTPGFEFWDSAALRLRAAPLHPSDIVASEGIGYIGFALPDSYIHDPLGLTDRHLARTGKQRYPFGRMDLDYTLHQVNPAVLLWHYAGNLRSVDAAAIDAEYVTYCQADCATWSADIVMLRIDRATDLGPYFSDWQRLSMAELYARNP